MAPQSWPYAPTSSAINLKLFETEGKPRLQFSDHFHCRGFEQKFASGQPDRTVGARTLAASCHTNSIRCAIGQGVHGRCAPQPLRRPRRRYSGSAAKSGDQWRERRDAHGFQNRLTEDRRPRTRSPAICASATSAETKSSSLSSSSLVSGMIPGSAADSLTRAMPEMQPVSTMGASFRLF